MRVGVVTGLALEALILARHWPEVIVEAAPGPERAGETARRLARDGVDLLVSFGTAGGLLSRLAPGTVVVASSVVDEAHGFTLNGAELAARELGASVVRLLSVERPILEPAVKRQAAARWSAAAVDMESAAVVRAAYRAACPALVVRAIADPADRRLPRLAATAVGPNGRLRARAIAAALIRWPGDWPAVGRAGVDAAAARAALGGAAARLAVLARQGLLQRLSDVPIEDVIGRPLP